ncbi:MAG: alpha amylase C-terminal domain-containing protein, partial [Deltaproteobacteria bacterium]|nr:alpha amylase C-terminal domain-containing protein [Deltaproteobacteria bacterium]
SVWFDSWDRMRDGYGVDTSRQLVVFHRWGNDDQGRFERFIVVLNFSDQDQQLDVPFSTNGDWRELLEGWSVRVTDWRLRGHWVGGNWGRVFFQREG